jgi:D-alanine-D-alanine ligase
MKKTRVIILFGGRSAEHEVSLLSARNIVGALDRERFEPVLVGIDKLGHWHRESERTLEAATGDPRALGLDALAPPVTIEQGLTLANRPDEPVGSDDVVFPVLHGTYGEDGTVQGMLELYDLPCAGSGCAASAVAMDKIRTRECLLHASVPMPRAFVPEVPLAQLQASALFGELERSVGLPCFVKVDCSGSTLGVQLIANEAELAAFLLAHRSQGRRLLAEELVTGEEITVGVLGNTGSALQALPPVGIYPKQDGFFTHAAKYEPGRTEEVIPPRGLDARAVAAVQELALRCHRALCCDGMSRTDMIVGPEGPRVLEVNTIPGLTAQSLLPQAAAAAGLPFPALLDHLLELALQRLDLPLKA